MDNDSESRLGGVSKGQTESPLPYRHIYRGEFLLKDHVLWPKTCCCCGVSTAGGDCGLPDYVDRSKEDQDCFRETKEYYEQLIYNLYIGKTPLICETCKSHCGLGSPMTPAVAILLSLIAVGMWAIVGLLAFLTVLGGYQDDTNYSLFVTITGVIVALIITNFVVGAISKRREYRLASRTLSCRCTAWRCPVESVYAPIPTLDEDGWEAEIPCYKVRFKYCKPNQEYIDHFVKLNSARMSWRKTDAEPRE